MTIRIKKVAPLQAGKMLAAFYGLISIIVVPIMILRMMAAPSGSAKFSWVLFLVLPLLYIIGGFIGGIIAAAFYNLAAGWIGGIEVEFEEQQPALPTQTPSSPV